LITLIVCGRVIILQIWPTKTASADSPNIRHEVWDE